MVQATPARIVSRARALAAPAHRGAALIIGLFLLIGVLYSVADPIFEATDELRHYPYVAHLAAGGGLPVQAPGQDALWAQEGSQPPLYYVLAAGLTSWIDTGDLPDIFRPNPHARIGIPLAYGNKNMMVHSSREAFPWTGTALAVHVARLFSLVLAAGSLLCTYFLVLELFPAAGSLALAVMAVQAFLPMFLFISASVNNDNLVTFLASLVLLLLVRLQRRGAARLQLAGLGVLVGLACLSKLSALALLPLAWLTLAVRQVTVKDSTGQRPPLSVAFGRLWPDLLAVTLPVLLVAGWWYVRNWLLYGDPTGLSAMLAVVGQRASPPSLRQLWGEFQGFRISFWGLFGGVNILLRPAWIYQVLDALSLAALAGLGLWAVRRRGRPLPWAGLFLATAWLGVEVAALLRWTSTTMASQGRLLFPALSVICLFLALGLSGWLPERRQSWGAWGLAGLLAVLAVTAPFTAIRPAYALPPIMTPAEIPARATAFNATYGGSVRLLAFELGADRVRPGESVPVTLYWEALAPTAEDCSLYLQLLGQNDVHLAQIDTYAGGTYPTSFWRPGQVIKDVYHLPVTAVPDGPIAARLIAGLYLLSSGDRLPIADPQGRPVGQPVLARVKVAGPSSAGLPAHDLAASFGDRVRLIGYDLPARNAVPGSRVPLTLYWEVTGSLDADYTVFLHVVDDARQMVGQGDAPPLGGDYPTRFWAPGERLADPHMIDIEPDARPGTYRIMAGLYRPETGQRLPVAGEANDQILVGSLVVQP